MEVAKKVAWRGGGAVLIRKVEVGKCISIPIPLTNGLLCSFARDFVTKLFAKRDRVWKKRNNNNNNNDSNAKLQGSPQYPEEVG